MADVKFDVKYNCAAGANATTKRNSLVGDGPLKVHPNQYFAVAFPASMKTVVDGHVLVNMHSCEYLTLAWMLWATELLDRNLAWYTLPARFASLLIAMDDAGKLIWKEYEDFDVLAEDFRKAISSLPDELRKLRLADTHVFAVVNPAATLFDRIKAKSLAGADTNSVVPADFKTLLGGYTQDERDDEDSTFGSTMANVVDVAGNDLGDKPVSIQAPQVVAFFRGSQPPHYGLRTYRSLEFQIDDVTRRAAKTKSAQFLPLLIAKWNKGDDAGYPEILQVFTEACNGNELARHASTLAQRGKLPPELTDETLVALCNMIQGQPLLDIDTPDLRNSSNDKRGAALGAIIATGPATGPLALDKTDASEADILTMQSTTAFKKEPNRPRGSRRSQP